MTVAFSAEHVTADNGAKVEIATVTFNGKAFTNLGSVVDKANGRAIGYPSGSKLVTWDGAEIGTVREISRYRNPRGVLSSWIVCYRAVIDGEFYSGRGCGDGMLLRLKRCKPAKNARPT